jgi:hypothetical protein
MANPGLSYHNPIYQVGTISGNAELGTSNILEGSGQTWQPGTPFQISTSTGPPNTKGYAIASTASNGTTQIIIKGFAYLPGRNYSSNGQGAAPPFGSIGYPGGAGAVQNIVNQPSAYSIYGGAPFVDGLVVGGMATLDVIWAVQVDASSGITYNYDATAIPLGSTIALNKDSNGFWYADLAHVNNSSYADLNIVGYNAQDLVAGSTVTQQNYGTIYCVVNTSAIQGLE